MSKPTIAEGVGFIKFTWADEMVTIKVTRLQEHRDGRVTGEILVSTTAPGYPSTHLFGASIANFNAPRSKKELANTLAARTTGIDWDSIVEQFTQETLRRVRAGAEVEMVDTAEEAKPPEYLLAPILPINEPTIIFGDGGSGKSRLALFLALCVWYPWEDNPLELCVRQKATKLLLLDWESTKAITHWRLKCLQIGHELPWIVLPYRRMSLPLADDLERIQELITQHEITFLIIDSLGMAAAAGGGNLNDTEPALRLMAAVRKLNITTLLLAHTSKDPNQKQKTVYGNAFYRNLARSVWELRKAEDTEKNEMSIGLFHNKANDDFFHPPIGSKITFGENSCSFEPEDPKTVEEFLERLTIGIRITEALKRGNFKIKELCELLPNVTENSIRGTVRRLLSKKEIIKLPDASFGLAEIKREI